MRAAMSFGPDSHFGAKAHEDALYISTLAVALSCGWFKPAFQFETSAAGVCGWIVRRFTADSLPNCV